MPKVKKAHCYVRDYPGVFRTDGAILFYTFCETNVSCDRKSQITQHLGTSKHIENSKLKSNKDQVSQQFIKNSLDQTRTNNQNLKEFSKDICTLMVANDIPLWKLQNPELKCFFEKYIKLKLPDESTLRKNYAPLCYEDVLRKIRKEIGYQLTKLPMSKGVTSHV